MKPRDHDTDDAPAPPPTSARADEAPASREGRGGQGVAFGRAPRASARGWDPRSLVGGLTAVAAVFLLLYGGALHAEARLDEDRPWAAALTAPLAFFSTALGTDGLVRDWAHARDRWYAEGFARDPSGDGASPEATDETDDAHGVDTVAAGSGAAAPEGSAAAAHGDGASAGPGDAAAGSSGDAAASRIHRILIVGASSIQFDLGRALEVALRPRRDVVIERWGQHSTGLSRADYFDWLAKARELRGSFRPDLVIAQMGGNDCQVITNVDGSEVARFPNDDWEPAYAARVAAFIDVFAPNTPVVFLGMPIMRSPAFREKVARLNRVTQGAVEAAGHLYVSTWEVTADDRGEYRGTAVVEGRERVFRANDGIHLSREGAQFVAEHVIAAIDRRLPLPPLPDAPGDAAAPAADAPAEPRANE